MDKKEYQQIFTNLIRFGCYDPQEYIINNEKKLIYLNNSKAACTSLKISLFNYNVKDDGRIHIILYNHKKNKIEKQDFPDYFVYTYVKNPFERIVSCYKNKIIAHPEYYKNYLGGILANITKFDDFVNRILIIPDILADRHFQSQYFLIYKNKKCTVDFIGKIETIKKSYPKLSKKYNLAPLKHYNTSQKNNWMDYYNISTAKKIYKRYKKDFKKFKYDKYYRNLLYYLKNK